MTAVSTLNNTATSPAVHLDVTKMIAGLQGSEAERRRVIYRIITVFTLSGVVLAMLISLIGLTGFLPRPLFLAVVILMIVLGCVGSASLLTVRLLSTQRGFQLFIYGMTGLILLSGSLLGGTTGPLFMGILLCTLVAMLYGSIRDGWVVLVLGLIGYVALSVTETLGVLSPLIVLSPIQIRVFTALNMTTIGIIVGVIGTIWSRNVRASFAGLMAQSAEVERQTETLLEQNIQQVEVGNELAAASTQLLSAAEQQARGATEQASAVSEISTTIEELGATARQIAGGAEQVTAAAGETLSNIADGQAAVDTAIQAMSQIRTKVRDVSERVLSLGERSHQIGEIIEVINDLSDETHLLALNAAIEAAGAGEHGRRFAVVAAEVKSLANRALAAAKEVKGVIAQVQQATNAAVLAAEDGGKEVDRGVVLANKAGSVMDQIVVAAERTAQVAAEINLATAQQQSASEQIVETMRDVAEVARQSAASARQTTGSAQALAAIANRLHGLTIAAE